MVNHPQWYTVGFDWRHGTYENWRVGEMPLHWTDPVAMWQDILPTVKARNFDTIRLAFSHPDHDVTHSPIDPDFDRVLTYLHGEGMKCILDLMNNPVQQDHAAFFGSWAWRVMWQELAATYGNDPRVTAFEIFNEPEQYTWMPDITDIWGVGWFLGKCYDDIKAVCDKPVIFPDPRFYVPYDVLPDVSQWMASQNYRPVEAIAFHRWGRTAEATQRHFDRLNVWKEAVPCWLGENGNASWVDFDLAVQILSHALTNNIAFGFWFVGVGSLENNWNYNQPLLDAVGWTEPPTPPVQAGCMLQAATGGTMLAGCLPFMRAFRDRCLPRQIIRDYYALSSYVAPKITKVRRFVGW